MGIEGRNSFIRPKPSEHTLYDNLVRVKGAPREVAK